MAHPKQAWEDLVETGSFLTDHLYALTNQGIVEFDILEWLAHYRRQMAKENFDCDEGEVDVITARILEETANELHRIGLEVVQSGIPPDPTAVFEISEETQRELNKRLLAVLDEGVGEIGILRWLALWRKQASMDEKRVQLRQFDQQLARVVHSAADKLGDGTRRMG
jgi:Holliday junction resolvase-like predicted endonuclease